VAAVVDCGMTMSSTITQLASHETVEAGYPLNVVLAICCYHYTVPQKNAPTLASCSFDKHGLF